MEQTNNEIMIERKHLMLKKLKSATARKKRWASSDNLCMEGLRQKWREGWGCIMKDTNFATM
jgi:hypothetical protein